MVASLSGVNSMEAKLLDIKPLKNGGWLISVEITQFIWRKFRSVTTQGQFFTTEQKLDYSVWWYNANSAERIKDPLEEELCRITYEYAIDEARKQHLFNLDMQVISNGEKRIPIE